MSCSCQLKEKTSYDYKLLYEQECKRTAVLEERIAAMSKENHALRLRDISMSNYGHEWMMNLQYKIKHLSERLAKFESGEIYAEMKAMHKVQLEECYRESRKLKREIAEINAQFITMRENWWQVFDDMQKSHEKEIYGKNSVIKILNEKLLETHKQLNSKIEQYREKCKELYEVKTILEEANDLNQKLMKRLKRNHENSSISSSMVANRKKIVNTREKSGKKPGGQVGHKHHPRKRQEPTTITEIPAPEKYANSSEYVKTGKIITKQKIEIQVNLVTTEYNTPEFQNIRTGQRVHAEFPGGLVDDVTYGGSIKALAFLLNSFCNVSIEKVSDLLRELTDGKLELSTGMICGLTKEFSRKTQEDRQKALTDILNELVINVDFSTVNVSGDKMNALVLATPNITLYIAKEHKGHEGIKDTPLEDYLWTLIHDHDRTFYSYGGNHQECLDHILRYLKSSIENEPNLTWNVRMQKLLREMIRFRKYLDPEDKRNPDEINPERVRELEMEYDEIIALAKSEYEYEPPGKYNRDGFNLYKRLDSYKENHLLFLHDRNVPYTNSLAERMLRILKRKMRQMMCFRSYGGFESLCDCLSVIATLRNHDQNLYRAVTSIYDRQIARKKLVG